MSYFDQFQTHEPVAYTPEGGMGGGFRMPDGASDPHVPVSPPPINGYPGGQLRNDWSYNLPTNGPLVAQSPSTGYPGGLMPSNGYSGLTPSRNPDPLSGPSTPAGAPGAGGGGDYQATFMRIMGGLPATPENLVAKEAELQAAGIQVHRNAEGVAGKIVLPGGQFVDVINSAGLGGGGSWQWLTGPTGGAAGGAGGGGMPGAGFDLATLLGGKSPMELTRNLPGYQFAVDEAMNSLQHGAAAKGTLLTGGFQKDLGKYIGNAVAGPAYQSEVGNLFNLAGIGENAAAGTGNAMGAYGQNASGLLTGIGNAQAGGSLASGSAWGNALNGLGNDAMDIYALNKLSKSGYGGMTGAG